jgi:ribonuclease HI
LKINKLELSILSVKESTISFCARQADAEVCFCYYTEDAVVDYEMENALSELLTRHQFQLKKIIRSALKANPIAGQTIRAVFIDPFTFLKAHDYSSYIRMDRRNKDLCLSTSQKESKGIHKIYADASFTPETQKSGFGVIIHYPTGERKVFSQACTGRGSNLMELKAVIFGLKKLKATQLIQINTDSRFVIRGMTQWMHFWRYNDWQTAYGSQVKYKSYWEEADLLCENKFIEFNWIKGHSGHAEQDLCHQLAKESAS